MGRLVCQLGGSLKCRVYSRPVDMRKSFRGLYALTFPHCLNRQPDYLWLQIKNGVRNE